MDYSHFPHFSQVISRDFQVQLFASMKTVAEHFKRPINAVARLERGIVHDADLAHRYNLWLETQQAS